MRDLRCGFVVFVLLVFIPNAAQCVTAIRLPDVDAELGQFVTIPVEVEDFSGVVVFEMYIDHSTSVVEFTAASGLNPTPVVNDVNGHTNISWFTTNPLTLSDGDTLLTLTYQIIGTAGNSTPLHFASDCYLADQTSHVIPSDFQDGSISVFGPLPPNPFHLLAPPDNTTLHTLDATFVWQSTSDPNLGDVPAYDSWLDTDRHLSTAWQLGDSLSDTTLAVGNLSDDVTYYWTVRATDSNTSGTWALDTLFFTTDLPQPPDSFSLLGPANGDTVWNLGTALAWSSTTDPDPYDTPQYDVWLDTLSDLTTSWLAGDSLADTTLALTGLMDDHAYYWSVRATDSNSDGAWSSDTLMFRTYLPEAPVAFALVAPEDGREIPSVDEFPLMFRWDFATDPDPDDSLKYQLQIAHDDAFSDPVLLDFISENSMAVDTLEQNVYYWRVLAQDRFGFGIYSSDVWSLNVTLAVPEDLDSQLPAEYAIAELFPNPFNPAITIVVGLPQDANLRVDIFNIMGRRVATINRGAESAGYRSYSFDGSGMASGVYFVHALVPGKLNQVRKIVLMK